MAVILTQPASAAPSQAVDLVAVLRASDRKQVFAAARPLKVTPDEGYDVMEHPLETGALIADHIVQKPTEISYPVIIGGDYKTTLAEIRAIAKAGTLLIVQTKSGNYDSMVLFDLPHEEDPENYDVIKVSLKFREAHFVAPQQGGPVPKTAKHANTVKRGQVQPAPAPAAPRGSFLFRHVPVK